MISRSSFQNVSIDNAHIDEKPQQITPPLARRAAHGIIISLLVVQVNTSHVLVVRNGGRDGGNLNNSSITFPVHCLVANWIRLSAQKTLTQCLSKPMQPGFRDDKILIHPFVSLSLRLFVVTNYLESLGDWSELFHKCTCHLSANHKQVL